MENNFLVSLTFKLDNIQKNSYTKPLFKSKKKVAKLLDEISFFDGAPFDEIYMDYIIDRETFSKQRNIRVSKDGSIKLKAKLDVNYFEYGSFNDELMLEKMFEFLALESLIQVGMKYNLPTESLKAYLQELGDFPSLPADHVSTYTPANKETKCMDSESVKPIFYTTMSLNLPGIRKNREKYYRAMSEVEQSIIRVLDGSGFMKDAPFKHIQFGYHIHEHNIFKQSYLRVDKYGFIYPAAMISVDYFEYASFNDEVMLEKIFEYSALEALIQVGKKYKLPIDALKDRLGDLGGFPTLPVDYFDCLPSSPRKDRIFRERMDKKWKEAQKRKSISSKMSK